MNKNLQAALGQSQGAETAEEIIGALTAISVVSKRMARKLALLEQRSAEKEGINTDGKTKAVPTHADWHGGRRANHGLEQLGRGAGQPDR